MARVLSALLLAAACSGGGADEAATATSSDDAAPDDDALEELVVRPSHRSVLAAVLVVRADRLVQVEVTATSIDHVARVPRTAEAFARHRIPVVGLRADHTYVLEVGLFAGGERVGGGRVDFRTGPLPDFLPQIEVAHAEPDRLAPGLTLFDTGRWDAARNFREPGGLLVAVDEAGEIVWYYRNPPSANDARLTPAGTILLQYPPYGIREIDLLGNRLRSWTWGDGPSDDPLTTVVDTEADIRAFHHEAYLAPSGNLFTLAIRDRELTEAQQAACGEAEPFGIAEDVVLELTPEGEVLHEWPLADVVDPADVPGAALCTETGQARDWAHTNGVILDEAHNSVIVSARHLDLVIAFRHDADDEGPSGELLWSLGPEGTLPLTEGTFAYHQHAPELEPDGSLLLYDNGNGRPVDVPFSRAVRYALDLEGPDPVAWSARQVWEHVLGDVDGAPVYADFVGDADLLPNGNVLIDHGGIGRGEGAPRSRIVEVVPTGPSGGDVVFDIRPEEPFISYRAQRVPSLYVGPRWRSDAVVRPS